MRNALPDNIIPKYLQSYSGNDKSYISSVDCFISIQSTPECRDCHPNLPSHTVSVHAWWIFARELNFCMCVNTELEVFHVQICVGVQPSVLMYTYTHALTRARTHTHTHVQSLQATQRKATGHVNEPPIDAQPPLDSLLQTLLAGVTQSQWHHVLVHNNSRHQAIRPVGNKRSSKCLCAPVTRHVTGIPRQGYMVVVGLFKVGDPCFCLLSLIVACRMIQAFCTLYIYKYIYIYIYIHTLKKNTSVNNDRPSMNTFMHKSWT